MEVVRLVETRILSVAEKILEILAGGSDYLSFEAQLKKELDNLGCDLLKTVLEALDQKLYGSEERKRDWQVVRRGDRKEVLTPFGLMAFERSYYRHKQSKRYCYLADEAAGLTPHLRISENLKADLVEAATELSYEESSLQLSRHNAVLKVSKQTVANCVGRFKAKAPEQLKEKRRVTELYIEADEVHLKIRGKRVQAQLIYIHEGICTKPRRHLKNVRYFTTVKKTPEQFWLEICDYLEANYELESLKAIYLCGDGASWIRTGEEYIPGAIFILDKFHLAKYIIQATAHAPELRKKIYKGIREQNKQSVLDHLQEALARAAERPRQERIRDTYYYISNNWEGIVSQVRHPQVGCSAEGHVSYILASRLSSRPMSWSYTGAEKMAALRAVKANKESVREHYLAKQAPAPMINLTQEVQKELKRLRQKRLIGTERLGNVPLFQNGSSLTRKALKGINSVLVV